MRACAPAVTPVVMMMMMMMMVAGHDGSVVAAQGHRGHGEYQLHYVLDLSVCLCVRAHLLSHL